MERADARWSGLVVAALGALAYVLVLFARGHPWDGDELAYGLPQARIFKDAVAAGRFPLWTDAIWCGYPAHAQGAGSFLFPTHAVALLPWDEVVTMELEIGLALVLSALAAAWAAHALGR